MDRARLFANEPTRRLAAPNDPKAYQLNEDEVRLYDRDRAAECCVRSIRSLRSPRTEFAEIVYSPHTSPTNIFRLIVPELSFRLHSSFE
uniref:Uncharacterized protein n=1 Tax=Anopheles quadriannulatus TaxID=34691 RepID=A0A182WYQ3_ANOQN